MGKNKLIKSLGKIVANVALHKLLTKHTNHPESKMFLNSEIIEYRNVALNKSSEYYWNEYGLKEIQEEAMKELKKFKEKYPDVIFVDEEDKATVLNVLKELKIIK